MSIQKISFSASLLDKNIVSKPNNIPTEEQTEELKDVSAEEVSVEENCEKENHKVRNWSIGLGSAAVLIGLGVAGRKGKLGKPIQKMLGGLKEINLDAINAKLNRAIPELSEDVLKIDKIPFSEYSDLSKVRAAEVIDLGDNLAQVHILPNNYKQILYGDKSTKKYTSYIVTDESNKNILVGCLDDSGELSALQDADGTYTVSYGKEKMIRVIAWVKKQINKDSYVMYHSNGEINYYSITEGNINKSVIYEKTSEGKLVPRYIVYKDVKKDVKIKSEALSENGKDVVCEQYCDEAGNIVKTVPEA